MPNIKSAKKRARQAEKRREFNRYYKTSARTYVKRARTLIEEGDFEAADEAVRQAGKVLDKAAQKKCIHKNNAARRKSRLAKALNRARAEQAA
ncbi:MAG: 30S ribosomal protein S20 [Chloroflexota bacterium]